MLGILAWSVGRPSTVCAIRMTIHRFEMRNREVCVRYAARTRANIAGCRVFWPSAGMCHCERGGVGWCRCLYYKTGWKFCFWPKRTSGCQGREPYGSKHRVKRTRGSIDVVMEEVLRKPQGRWRRRRNQGPPTSGRGSHSPFFSQRSPPIFNDVTSEAKNYLAEIVASGHLRGSL